MPPKGAPRNCRKCLYKHVPPTGAKCTFNVANMSFSQQAKLVHVVGPAGTGDTDSEGEGEEGSDFQQVTDCLGEQQEQLTGLAQEFQAMRTTVTDLQAGVQQILGFVKPPDSASPLTSTPKPLGACPPLMGGVRPPSGPIPPSDSEDEDSDSDADHRRKKRRKPYDLARYYPKGVRVPVTPQQLVGALSRMQTVHLQKQPHWTPYCVNIQLHIQFLCDRADMGLYSMKQLIAYDEGIRGRANHFDAQAFVYGDEEMVSQHLVYRAKDPGASPATTPTTGGAQGGGSSKKKDTKPKFVPDPESPCWRYNNFSCNSGASCAMRHVCYHCWDPAHKMKACTNVKRASKPSA